MQIEVNTFILHKQWTPQSGHAMPTWSSPGGTGPPFSSELSPSLEGHRSSGSGEHTCPRSHLQVSLLARGRVPPAPAPDWTPGHLHTHTHTQQRIVNASIPRVRISLHTCQTMLKWMPMLMDDIQRQRKSNSRVRGNQGSCKPHRTVRGIHEPIVPTIKCTWQKSKALPKGSNWRV